MEVSFFEQFAHVVSSLIYDGAKPGNRGYPFDLYINYIEDRIRTIEQPQETGILR